MTSRMNDVTRHSETDTFHPSAFEHASAALARYGLVIVIGVDRAAEVHRLEAKELRHWSPTVRS